MLTGLTAEEWTAIGTGATALILMASLVYAAVQVREARALRQEQFRPWVTVSFHFRSVIAFAAIRNLGSTAARDVRIRFEPELMSTLTQEAPPALLSEPIPVLVPGEERLILLDRIPDRLESDLPRRHTAFVDCRDHQGRRLPSERYTLDFGLLDGARLPDKTVHDLVEEVHSIRQQLSAD